jgi:WD40 repeat protein
VQPNYSATQEEPARVAVPFDAGATCYAISNAIDAAEAARIVDGATRAGFAPTGHDYPPSYRDNDRLVRDDQALAKTLFERLRGVLPGRIVDGRGDEWRLSGLNERFRYCRYTGGQSFRIHRDGAHAPSPRLRSHLTLQIYLDDGFEGGRTRFYPSRVGPTIGAVRAKRGRAIVFDHRLWHDGEPVPAGVKHVLRTDVMYRRVGGAKEHRRGLRGEFVGSHGGYVFALAVLGDGSVVSGSRDRSLRRFVRGEHAWTCERVVRGHEASVLALVEARPGVVWSGSRDRTVRETDLRDGREGPSPVVGRAEGAILALCRAGDGAIVAGSADGLVHVFRDAEARKATWSGHSGWVWSVAALELETVASGSEDGTLRVWDLATGETLASASPGRGPVHAVTELGRGRVGAGFADGHVLVYALDLARGRLEAVDVIHAHDGEVYALAHKDGFLATAGEDDRANVFSTSHGTLRSALPHDDFVRAVVWRGDELLTGSYDGTIRSWSRFVDVTPVTPVTRA